MGGFWPETFFVVGPVVFSFVVLGLVVGRWFCGTGVYWQEMITKNSPGFHPAVRPCRYPHLWYGVASTGDAA